MRTVRRPRRDHAGAAAHGALAARVALGLLEVADQVVEAPARSGRGLPGLVVGPVAVQPDGRVDARPAADHLPHRRDDAAAVQVRLRHGRAAPVGVGAEVARPQPGIGNLRLADIGAAALDQQHRRPAVLRQPVRHHAARSACAYDHIVVFGLEALGARTCDERIVRRHALRCLALQRLHRVDAIAAALLLDPGQRREREVIALHRKLLGDQHVVDALPRGGGLRRVLVEEAVPVRMGREHRDVVADVRLHKDGLVARIRRDRTCVRCCGRASPRPGRRA